MAFKKGHKPWNTGKKRPPMSEETRRKISLSGLGRKSPMKGKKISESHRKNISLYKKWREAVFERDNYTCQYCGLHSGCGKTVELHPHHIISFSSILNKLKFQFGIDNLFENAIKCELLWDISNGITLCSDCHHKTDNYGRPYAS
jgi:5-methylcytosine-specific restriction endonuclease McrA